jgi:hypothetical protein
MFRWAARRRRRLALRKNISSVATGTALMLAMTSADCVGAGPDHRRPALATRQNLRTSAFTPESVSKKKTSIV